MRKIKLASLVLFVMMAFACEKSLAQSNKKKEPQAAKAPDQNATAPDNGTPQSNDPNAGNETTNVTIDSASTAAPAGASEAPSTPVKSESSTKIHIYSGKHDGNNVINPDPKN